MQSNEGDSRFKHGGVNAAANNEQRPEDESAITQTSPRCGKWMKEPEEELDLSA